MSDRYRRFPADALLIVDDGTSHAQWTGAQWNEHVTAAEHDGEPAARLIRVHDRGTASSALGPERKGLAP